MKNIRILLDGTPTPQINIKEHKRKETFGKCLRLSAFGSGTAPFWLSRADSGAKVESSGEQKWIAGAAMEQKAEHLTKKT